MINVCERESLGVGESCEKWELSELEGEKYRSIYIWDSWGGCKIYWNLSLIDSSSILNFFYCPRIAEIGGVGGEIYYCGSRVCYTWLSV